MHLKENVSCILTDDGTLLSVLSYNITGCVLLNVSMFCRWRCWNML
jgi:hypothetical protein